MYTYRCSRNRPSLVPILVVNLFGCHTNSWEDTLTDVSLHACANADLVCWNWNESANLSAIEVPLFHINFTFDCLCSQWKLLQFLVCASVLSRLIMLDLGLNWEELERISDASRLPITAMVLLCLHGVAFYACLMDSNCMYSHLQWC